MVWIATGQRQTSGYLQGQPGCWTRDYLEQHQPVECWIWTRDDCRKPLGHPALVCSRNLPLLSCLRSIQSWFAFTLRDFEWLSVPDQSTSYLYTLISRKWRHQCQTPAQTGQPKEQWPHFSRNEPSFHCPDIRQQLVQTLILCHQPQVLQLFVDPVEELKNHRGWTFRLIFF